jgi:hypothetical protein
MGALRYFGLKLVAYSGWCYLGLYKFRREQKPVFPRFLVYGFFRLVVGFFFALLVCAFPASGSCELRSILAFSCANPSFPFRVNCPE